MNRLEGEHGRPDQQETTPAEAKRPENNQPTLKVGEGRGGIAPPELAQAQPPVESAEGSSPAPLTPEQQRKKEKKKASNSRYYQKKRTERLADRKTYHEGHKTEIQVYQREYMREYMRDYRQGKRRRSQAEPQPPIQVFAAS